jgi:hypothetical protein
MRSTAALGRALQAGEHGVMARLIFVPTSARQSPPPTGTGHAPCLRTGPDFSRTCLEYTEGGVKRGGFFSNECGELTTDTAEGLGCCRNSSWHRESAWTLSLWGR